MNAQLAAPSRTRIAPRWLRLAQIAWLVVLALTVAKISIGLPQQYRAMNNICLAPAEECQQDDYLTPQQAEQLEASGNSLATYARMKLAWFLFTASINAVLGLFIFWKRSNDWLALLISASLMLLNSAGLESEIRAAYPVWGSAADVVFSLGNILMFLFFAFFPSGRFAPRWMRWYWLGMILISLIPNKLLIVNPVIANTIIVFYWVSFLILGPYSQFYRYRHESTAIERQQTKWVVFGFSAFAGSALLGFILSGLLPKDNAVFALYNGFYFDAVGLFLPLSIAFSVLRYRLWEVDLLIRRTLQYSLVTGVLALVFFGSVTVLQSIFSAISGEQSSLAIALSTLGIAALFNPLRKRVQSFIDRRFFRQKYNAELALAAFAATARNETNLGQLTSQMIGTVQDTLQPETMLLWLRPSADRTVRKET
jgi:hypothetical protein